MRIYEATFILSPDLEEEQLLKAQEKYTEMVTNSGGEIVNVENWGKRRLAYETKGKTEGVYVVLRFKSGAETAKTLRRDFGINDSIIKSLIIKLN